MLFLYAIATEVVPEWLLEKTGLEPKVDIAGELFDWNKSGLEGNLFKRIRIT